MKNFLKFAKVSLMVMACALFLGIGMKAEAAPGTIIGLKQTGANGGAVSVEWQVPANTDPAVYVVMMCENEKMEGDTLRELESYENEGIINGLKSGKSYYIQVCAVDYDGSIGDPTAPFEVVTAPAGKVTGIKQTKAEAKKITLSWKKSTGANVYSIGYVKKNKAGKTKWITTKDSKTSYTFTAAANTKYSVAVVPARKSKSGFVAEGANMSDVKDMSSMPKKVSKVRLLHCGSGSNSQAKVAYFSWNKCDAATGYEYTVYGNSGKKIVKGTTTKNTSVQIKKIPSSQFMKISVRPYITVNGKKKYGPKSADCWFAKHPALSKRVSWYGTAYSVEYAKISWAKMTGAKNYTVYITTTPGVESSFKKVATVTGTSCTIRKCNGYPLNRYTRYYVRVVASKKVGKKTVKSDDAWSTPFSL